MTSFTWIGHMSGTQIRLDTHVVVWIHTFDSVRLSTRALELVEARDLIVSPAVALELTYLHEIGRIAAPGAVVLDELRKRVGLQVSAVSFDDVVSAASSLPWTRDPFDRLIAGDASAAACELLTRDRLMLEHFPLAVW
jgi:PIN domain nuclease of toxin-antitoxin system